MLWPYGPFTEVKDRNDLPQENCEYLGDVRNVWTMDRSKFNDKKTGKIATTLLCVSRFISSPKGFMEKVLS